MTTPHPHADFIVKHVTGEDTSEYEAQHNEITQRIWQPADNHSLSIFCMPSGWKVRRTPIGPTVTKKVIDWSQLGRYVPVYCHDGDGDYGCVSYISELNDGGRKYPFRCGENLWAKASLDTGLWVYNHDGVNPWPEGCTVEVVFRDSSLLPDQDYAFVWNWNNDGRRDQIIASRFHSLDEGWSFGHE